MTKLGLLMEQNQEKSLEKVRQIILREAQKRVNTLEHDVTVLREMIEDRESLIESLEPVISDLLERKTIESKEEMVEALSPIMGAAIKKQVAEAKDDVVDALYPVIGKTIRKSIAEAMKNLIDSVNQKIDKTLRSTLFIRRIQSKITGVSEAELALKDSIPYKVEEVFLIHKSSGLLIGHVSAADAASKVNTELISGMLTAIQNFINESFSKDSDSDLDEIKYGDSTILMEAGHYSYLAIVVSGIVPTNFYDNLHKLDRRIHNYFYKQLRKFDGDKSKLGDVTAPMRLFMEEQAKQPVSQAAGKSKPYFLYLLIFLIISTIITLVIWKGPTVYHNFVNARAASEQLLAEPSLYDQNIKCSVSGQQLIVRGEVKSYIQKSKIDSILKTMTQFEQFENRIKVRPTRQNFTMMETNFQTKLAQIRELQKYKPRFIFEDNQIIIEGSVPDIKIKRDIGFLVSEATEVRIVTNNLKIDDIQQRNLSEVRRELKKYVIRFKVDDLTIQPEESRKLDSAFYLLQGVDFDILQINGFSDNLADSTYNMTLSFQRARAVGDYLGTKGIPEEKIQINPLGEKFPIAPNDTPEGRALNRRVELVIY